MRHHITLPDDFKSFIHSTTNYSPKTFSRFVEREQNLSDVIILSMLHGHRFLAPKENMPAEFNARSEPLNDNP